MRHVRIQDNSCHIWLGSKNKDGYGTFRIAGKMYYAHRIARYLYCGFDLNSVVQVNHKPDKCNNSACVNVDHTYEGNQRNNMEDIVKYGNHNNSIKTHCPQGHEYTKHNTLSNNNTGRRCRICHREKEANRRYIRH